MTPQDTQLLYKSLMEIGKLSEKYKTNFIHNYAWREHLQRGILNIILDTGISSDNKVTGEDFKTSMYQKVELKSCKGERAKTTKLLLKSKCKFEFDKQNDDVKIQQTREYDCLLFSIFESDTPEIVVNILIHGKKAITEFNNLVIDKQNKFKIMHESCIKNNKRIPRDSIKFDYSDIVTMVHCEFYTEATQITLNQFKDLFH